VTELSTSNIPRTVNVAEELLCGLRGGGGRTAVVSGRESLSYDTLRRRVVERASQLVRAGAQPGDRIALALSNGPDFVEFWLAVQWIGAISVALPPSYRRREISYVVNHSGASLVVCGSDTDAHVRAAQACFVRRVPLLAVRSEGAGPAPAVPHAGGGPCPAAITYISSAEGTLKGVVHTREGILASADAYTRDVLALGPGDVCVGALSLSWAFGVGSLLVFPLRVSASTVLLESASVGALLSAIGESRATVLFGVPTSYRMLLRHPGLDAVDLGSLRCCVSAGEPLPAAVAREWRARTGTEILDGLGTTELTHIFISNRIGASRPGLIGTPVAGFEAKVVDDALREVPPGISGRLMVRGPTSARYWNDVEADRRAVHDGWTLTGDVCIEHPDGWFEHLRRTDALIVSAGHKISAAEVERVLEEHPEVARARVFAEEDAVRGQVVRAAVSPAVGGSPEGLGLRLQEYLRTEIAAFKCPREIRILSA
jgi:2-aminobenzoate-CoA ligase